MSRVGIVMSLLAMLLIGISLGVVCGILIANREPRLWHRLETIAGRRAAAAGPGGRLAEALPRLTKTLGLSPEQVSRLEPKLVASRHEFEAVRESVRSRIDSELTPSQRTRWHQILADRNNPGARGGAGGRAYRAQPGLEGDPR